MPPLRAALDRLRAASARAGDRVFLLFAGALFWLVVAPLGAVRRRVGAPRKAPEGSLWREPDGAGTPPWDDARSAG